MSDMILFAIGAAIMTMIVYAVNSYRKYRNEQEIARIAEERKQVEETRKWRERMHEKMKKDAVANTSSVPPRGKEMTKTYTPSYAPSPTQSVQASRSDDGIDMITNMMVMNAIMQHHQPSASTSNEIVSTSSSPSSRDSGPSYVDDSPKSSWSFSSSSDSSSSWSSSSDSGPSSDW